jgi:hypothetical protein
MAAVKSAHSCAAPTSTPPVSSVARSTNPSIRRKAAPASSSAAKENSTCER